MEDSHWTRHEATIRRLYVTERKSLKEIKRIMETEHGFPETKLSTWESTLRDRLGVFKKLKKEHWRLLYQEYERRGERPFDLYADNVLVYPWSKAWKELRRRRRLVLQPGFTLPTALSIRTPPPVQSAIVPPPASPNAELATTSAVAVRTSSWAPRQSWLATADSATREWYRGFIKVQTESVPWNLYRLESMADEVYDKTESDGITTYALMPKDGFLAHAPSRLVAGRLLARIVDTQYPHSSIWDSTSPHFTQLSAEFNGYHVLSWLVYLASNDLVKKHQVSCGTLDWTTLLDLLIHRVPRRIVTSIFSSNSLSIKATWEAALKNADELCHAEAIDFLIDTVLDRHFDWLEPLMNHTALFAAARCGSITSLRKLLAKGARPCWVSPYYPYIDGHYETAILAAVRGMAWDCVQLLLEHCDIHGRLNVHQLPAGSNISHCQILFQFIEEELSTSWKTNPDDGKRFMSDVARTEALAFCARALDLYLAAGADVDLPYFVPETANDTEHGLTLQHFYKETSTPDEWLPTCLDMLLYWDKRLFDYFKQHSSAYNCPRTSTRAGICKAISQGGHIGLDHYFKSHARPAQDILEMLLAEQFFSDFQCSGEDYSRVDGHLARLLTGYGIAVNSDAVRRLGGVSLLLRRTIACARGFGYDDDMRFIMIHLLRNGATFCERAVGAAIERTGVHLLEVLVEHGVNIQRDGKLALLLALHQNNLEAADWLLDRGVSIFSVYPDPWKESHDFTLTGAFLKDYDYYRREKGDPLEPAHMARVASTCETVEFLRSKGTHPRIYVSDQSPYTMFMSVTDINAVMWISTFLDEMGSLSDSERRDIVTRFYSEISRDQRLFERLQSRYQDFDAGHILAAAIYEGGDGKTIERLLETTSNLELYSGRNMRLTPLQAAASIGDERLVRLLLGRGADVNAPAHSPGGKTAFQAICHFKPFEAQQVQARRTIIQLMLEKGASFYPPGNWYVTPFNILAANGDLGTANLFLEHGVDPNYVSWGVFDRYEDGVPGLVGRSALDESSSWRRLDMTHFLLKSGALSADPGSTGYEGALTLAHSTAIKEVIQRHIRQREEDFAQSPALRTSHQAEIDRMIQSREQAACELGVDPWAPWESGWRDNDEEGSEAMQETLTAALAADEDGLS